MNAIFNAVMDDVRMVGFNKRTKWVEQPDGSKRGVGMFAKSDGREQLTSEKGSCVRENLEVFLKLFKAGAKFFHGELRSRLNEWSSVDGNRGRPIYHAWVELGDKVFDYSNGTKMVMDTDLFYIVRRVKRAEQIKVDVLEIINGNEITLRPQIDEEQRTRFYRKIIKKQRALRKI